jgi:hypothetical protein
VTSASRVATDLAAGAQVVLQRVPRSMAADTFASALGRPAAVVTAWSGPIAGTIRVLDARQRVPDFADLDGQRAFLATADSPLVVLLDAASARAMLADAPHLASWAGGVWLPGERAVRYANNEAERERGHILLARRIGEEGLQDVAFGRSVGVDLATTRVFVPSGDDDAITLARRALDEGIVHVELWGGARA